MPAPRAAPSSAPPFPVAPGKPYGADPKYKDSKILLGTKNDGTVPTEPVLLGNQTQDFLLELLKALSRLAGYLSTATAVASDGAIPIESCNEGGTQLFNDVDSLISKLEKIISNKVYTV
jgi:hypothetical protein